MIIEKRSPRIACDVKGKKIGKIIEEEATSDKITVAKHSLLGKTVFVTFTQQDIIKQEGKNLWLKISKTEFNLFVKRKRTEIKQKVKAAKFAEASGSTKAITYAFTWGKI